MAKNVNETIKKFRSDPKNEQLFLESEAELDLASHLRSLREQARITQQELADRLGRSQAFVAKMEGGAYDRCGIGTLRTFARALGYDLNIATMFKKASSAAFAGFITFDDEERYKIDWPISLTPSRVRSVAQGTSGATFDLKSVDEIGKVA